MTAIGIDIGGANLKISDGEARTISLPFPLWKSSEKLPEVLAKALRSFPASAPLAMTMTGELADCFPTRANGVQAILSAVESAGSGRAIGVWQTSGEFAEIEEAREFPPLVAAGNWHALATWAARIAPDGEALLIDIGSTTTDIIPMRQGLPLPAGRTDLERLKSGELIYLGVRRTPLCAVISDIELDDHRVPLAREVFATSLDVFLHSGLISEGPEDLATANGRPAVRAAAADRLARQICSDGDELDEASIAVLAETARSQMHALIKNALQRQLHQFETAPMILLAGEGEFLTRAALADLTNFIHEDEIYSLTNLLGPTHSAGACAYALSRLGRESTFFTGR